MNAPVLLDADQILGATALASADMVDGLIGRYKVERGRIDEVVAMTSGETFAAVAHHFFEGNANQERGRTSLSLSAKQLFELEGAVAHLNACYWQQAMDLTDVYNAMPQKRRDEWNAMIRQPLGQKKDYHETQRDRNHRPEWFDRDGYIDPANGFKQPPIPEFDEQTVRSTLQGLLLSRSQFFAERVDGIFQALSRTHVTNCPEGFGKRMILTGINSGYYSTERAGYINDLRAVIAKFMGRDEPNWNATGKVVEAARHQRGQWLTVDGGALRVRCYMNGNAHLEVHPDISWRLNCVLAQLHPAAIPSQFRAKPKKVAREWQAIQRPLPFAVLACLESLEQARGVEKVEPCAANRWEGFRHFKIKNAVQFRYGMGKDAAADEARQVLAGLGGVQVESRWQFDYDPTDVIREVIASGCLPDVKSHQFYPTQEKLAKRAVELAEIGPEHDCLEPSAGMGGLADFMPKDQTLCVELSALHCEVLKAKGFRVDNADFLSWGGPVRYYNRIVMNPPFADGRWKAHVDHASKLVAGNGRMVAILPSGARNSLKLDGFNMVWHGPYSNEFPGVSVDVVILVADRA